MATYVISDIHARLDAFKLMLKKIDFKYDGTDSLHILGDMIDCGDKPIETLQFIMNLDKTYTFIEVYLGNHDRMMYETIANIGSSSIWYKNRGKEGHEQYLRLSKREQAEIREYLENLQLYNDNLCVNGKYYYLAHASSLDIYYPSELDRMDRSIWYRLGRFDNPFNNKYSEKYKNHTLVYGHTIAGYYNSLNNDGEIVIFKDLAMQKICIDCGAKVFNTEDGITFRLAALRLDDMQEFYVSRRELNNYLQENTL